MCDCKNKGELMKVEFAKPQRVGVSSLMSVGNYEYIGNADGLGITLAGHNLGDLALWAGLGAAVGHFAFKANSPKQLAIFGGGALALRLLLT
jgi:hypothetical protein